MRLECGKGANSLRWCALVGGWRSERAALTRPPSVCCRAQRRGRQVALDVAEALVYLHTKLRVLHSDLKAA